MDAFTVSIIDGLSFTKISKLKLLIIPLMFSLFQGLMPLIGHYIGSAFLNYIDSYDHYISFAILLFIGGKMIFDSIKEYKENRKIESELKTKNFNFLIITLQAIATAIDALVVGLTLQQESNLNIYIDISIIIFITFVFCIIGVFLGKQLSKILKGHFELAKILGGFILILISIKILLSGLGIINF